VEKQAKRLDQALGTSIVFFSLFFFLDKKERKNQDRAKTGVFEPGCGEEASPREAGRRPAFASAHAPFRTEICFRQRPAVEVTTRNRRNACRRYGRYHSLGFQPQVNVGIRDLPRRRDIVRNERSMPRRS